MSAEEMFKELGYKKIKHKENGEEIGIEYKNSHDISIIFDLLDCDFVKFGRIWENLMNSSIDMKELQAINKQTEELGWE